MHILSGFGVIGVIGLASLGIVINLTHKIIIIE